ncbi:polyphosphate kinase 1 [Crocinitomicaceae bacterium]|nr:polyphosphate kinase 1 [Crocinitomicaceae bacterium]MDB3906477.1 polyphosphate kinase 1 [Crocinitomicaceae bacterium]
MRMGDHLIHNRELSWLSFNERVLQEAMDENNPLIERVRFMGIFSNNRDEFFRVRVASVSRMMELGKKARSKMYDDPEELLKQISDTVVQQESRFLRTYKSLSTALGKAGVHLVDNKSLTPEQMDFVLDYFKDKVRPALVPLMLTKKGAPELTDKSSYLAVRMEMENEEANYALIEIPSQILPRFLVLPEVNGQHYVMFLDDVIRLGLSQIFKIFPYKHIKAYAMRMTRDAELDIDEDIDESVLEKLSKSVNNRRKAQPVRFVHDKHMPTDLLDFLIRKLRLKGNIIQSGRYHNLRDFMGFPDFGLKEHCYENWTPSRHPELVNQQSLLDVLAEKDIMLNYPFQSFSHTIDILREAAIDPGVQEIKINMYRVASNSNIVNALINASKNGKRVTAVIELHARFDEEHNILISKKLQENGVRVIFGVEGLKVHCKLVVITRKKGDKMQYFTHVGTGNFHEKTAKLYTDISLWTSDNRISKEVYKIFDFFKTNYKPGNYRHLVVSPFNVRSNLSDLIEAEMKNARAGKEAYIIIKLNNLVDEEMIEKLYEASQAGVKIQMIIRGICCLVPGVEGVSENIEVISILDRYLEHTRIFVFANAGNELMYISSADWMGRNLDRRIEVAAPIYDPGIKADIRKTLDFQLNDNQKARIIDDNQNTNHYKTVGDKKVRSQEATHKFFAKKMKG